MIYIKQDHGYVSKLKSGEREQDLPAQNMPFWHKDYYRLIMFKKQQTQEKVVAWAISKSYLVFLDRSHVQRKYTY